MILICAQVNCNEISTNRLRFNIQDQRLYCFDHYKLKDRKKKRKPKFQPIPSHWLSEDINGLINLTCSQGENCPSDKLEVVDKNLLCENHIPLQRPLDTKELSVTKQDLQTYPPSAPPHIAPKTVKKLELRQNDVFLKLDENIPESDKLNSLPVTIKCTLEKLVEQIDNGQDEETQQDCNISMRLLFKSISKEASKRFHSGGISLADCTNKSILKESALLGLSNTEEIFLNLYEPFCIATFGLQGSGKSHSLSVIVENCLLSTSNCVHNEDKVIIDLKTSMCCLVLHYDQSAQSVCEVTGLTKPRIGRSLCLSNDRMIVLVSPTYYLQRKAFYGPNINVRPLLFEWRTMTADRLRKLMRLSSDDTQLYVATLLDILRSYQRLNRLPLFKDFINEVCSKADVKGQSAPLIQRLNILQSFIHESSKNSAIKAYALDISAAIKSGFLIVADISDPLLSKEEASGVFELLVESFRTAPLTGCGKLLALDEAHKVLKLMI